jgi:hypothetical protein
MNSRGPESGIEMQFLARPDCGVCVGDPTKAPCPEKFEKEHLELPALEHADQLCIMALYHMLERTPTRFKRTQSRHSWNLIDTAIRISRQQIYQAETTSLLDISFQIANHVKHREYEGAYEQIQSRTILAYEALLRGALVNAETGITHADFSQTCSRIGGVIDTIENRFHEYYENDEVGIADNLSAQLEIAYLGLRAGIPIWPASVRQEKSRVQRENYDLYADYGPYIVPIQVVNHEDNRTYDSQILKLRYPQFRREIMSMNGLKAREYSHTIRQSIVLESEDKELSPAKRKRLDRGSARLQKIIASHVEKNF